MGHLNTSRGLITPGWVTPARVFDEQRPERLSVTSTICVDHSKLTLCKMIPIVTATCSYIRMILQNVFLSCVTDPGYDENGETPENMDYSPRSI